MNILGFKVERLDTDKDLEVWLEDSTAEYLGKGLRTAGRIGKGAKAVGRGLFNGLYRAINE